MYFFPNFKPFAVIVRCYMFFRLSLICVYAASVGACEFYGLIIEILLIWCMILKNK